MNSGDLRNSDHSKGRLLAEEVLDYLVRHPEAQDTVEGIAEWWLLERRVARVVAEVEVALAELVGRDFLIAHRSDNGRTYYRLNRGKEREIRRILRKPRSAPESDQGAQTNKGL